MNLLDSIKQGWIAFLFIPVLFGCEQENEPLQLDIDNALEARLTEYQLPLQTIFIDSIRTDNENNIGIGHYEHERWGSVSAKAYNGFEYSSGSLIADSLQLDSLILTFEIKEKFLPEGEVQGEIFIYRLDGEEIYPSVVYLGDVELPIEDIPIDTINASFLNTEDTIARFRLDGIGFEMFNLARDSSTLSGFSRQYAFVPSDDLNAFFTIDTQSDTTEVIMYSNFADTAFYETLFTLDTEHFTSLKRDRSGSEIAEINNLDTLVIEPGSSPLNPLFGLYPLADLRAFTHFLSKSGDILINKAELEIKTFSPSEYATDQVRFYFYKSNSGIKGEGLLGDYEDWINTAILENDGYLTTRPPSRPEISELSESKFLSDVTIYADVLLSFYQEENSFLNDRIVIMPNSFLTGKSIEVSDLPLFTVYYSEIND